MPVVRYADGRLPCDSGFTPNSDGDRCVPGSPPPGSGGGSASVGSSGSGGSSGGGSGGGSGSGSGGDPPMDCGAEGEACCDTGDECDPGYACDRRDGDDGAACEGARSPQVQNIL